MIVLLAVEQLRIPALLAGLACVLPSAALRVVVEPKESSLRLLLTCHHNSSGIRSSVDLLCVLLLSLSALEIG